MAKKIAGTLYPEPADSDFEQFRPDENCICRANEPITYDVLFKCSFSINRWIADVPVWSAVFLEGPMRGQHVQHPLFFRRVRPEAQTKLL